MKNLMSKVVKVVGMAGFVLGSFFLPKDAYPQNLNGPTPWEVIGNTYSQPNVGSRENGLSSLEWYGSGDVNLDGKVDSLDLQSMNQWVQNNMSDIDGDGFKSTANDKSVLSEYLTGQRDYLPGHWNELKTPEERGDWFSKMISINDGINGIPPGWVCADYIRQMELDFYGCSNYTAGYNQGFWKPETHIDSVSKFNLPMYYFSTTNTSGVSHAVAGVLVGRRINSDLVSLNPLDFKDWYFIGYNNDEKVLPGNFNMSPNHPVEMKKSAYVKNPITGQNVFDFTGPYIKWDLNNGEPTLTYHWPFNPSTGAGVLLENPNAIKVHVGDLENLVLNGGNVLPEETSLTPDIIEQMGYNGVPDTTKENTLLPINLVYSDKDTTWSEDSTSFSFNRDFYGWIYSGGVTKSDSTKHNLKVENLIGSNVKVHVGGLDSLAVNMSQIPPGQNLTPEFLESIGYDAIPDTTKENTNLQIKLFYVDRDTVWSTDSTSKSFDRDFYARLYSFGKTLTDSTKQNIKLVNLTSVGELEKEVLNDFELSQNYPNPFNPSTTIEYNVPESSKVKLKVYNLLGEEVKNLVEKVESPGNYKVNFDASELSSGVYIYKFDAKSDVSDKKYSKSGKMVLVK
ncbi:MAG: T9SS type A sorting domain-containing protein [Nanoarchaeota archaeon]|nr:T9SS type A sorting domain-containing protein [Nanoarchaeota archaeon]